MKTQETQIKVLDKEIKKGSTNDGRAWEIVEYTIMEEMEREDGSVAETKLRASTSQAVGELKIGGIYKAVIFITSRESEKDGKKTIWNSFRITRADVVSEPQETAPATESPIDTIDDSLPF